MGQRVRTRRRLAPAPEEKVTDNEGSAFVWVRIRRRIAHLITSILRGASAEPHNRARQAKDPDVAQQLRQEGDDIHEVAKDVERAMHPPEDKP